MTDDGVDEEEFLGDEDGEEVVGLLVMGPETPDSIKAVVAFFVHVGEVQLATRVLERFHWYNQLEQDDGE